LRLQFDIMAKTNTKTNPKSGGALFGKENYKWMLIGAALLTLGFFLMSGGKSEDPNQFNSNDIYSTTRITIAPILIIAGFVIEIYAIMRKSKDTEA